MTERERLIDLLNQDCGYVEEQPAEKLADYLLENGVIVLPCKVGDTVYEVVGKCEFRIYDDCVFRGGHGYSRCYDEGKVGERCNAYIEEIKFTLSLVDCIGERIFLTREEAEKALEKLR